MTYDPSTIALMAGALLVAGAFAGVLAGLLGIGGGIVIVPALFYLFTLLDIDPAIKMHLAVGTSLSTIIATSLSSIRSHHRRGAVDWPLLRSWGPAVAVGVVIGTVVAGLVSGEVLTGVFATMALLVAANMAFQPESARLADRLPGGPVRFVIGSLIGGFSAMMGIGGGTFTVPTLVMCSYPIRRAVGTAAAVGLIIAVPGTIGFMIDGYGRPELPPFSLGYVSVLGFVIIAPMTVMTAPLGARIAHTINTRWLRWAFALFLALTSLRMYQSLF